MQTFIRKITSRKFLSCIAGVVLGISMIFGVDENVVSTVAGAVTSVVSLAIYIYSEGKIDAARVSSTASKVTEAIDAVKEIEE